MWWLWLVGCLPPEPGDPCTVDEDCGELYCALAEEDEGVCAIAERDPGTQAYGLGSNLWLFDAGTSESDTSEQ